MSNKIKNRAVRTNIDEPKNERRMAGHQHIVGTLPLFSDAVPPDTTPLPLTVDSYKGLSGFHKYWGKKPVDYLQYLIQIFTSENDIIIDPFLGSGLIGRYCLLGKRRFIGIDVNPIAIELASLWLELPNVHQLAKSLRDVTETVREQINTTYLAADGHPATHILWNGDTIKSLWRITNNRKRIELEPTDYDYSLARCYESYSPRHPRALRLFDNSRINSKSSLSLHDLFTGRALHNIDLLLDAISQQPQQVQRSLLLSLTSASGQMSNMVFAITGRGKTTGHSTDRIEVGSWTVGYWRPQLHFEINVLRCFEKRASQLVNAIKDTTHNSWHVATDIANVLDHTAHAAIVEGDALTSLQSIPDGCASLVLTDPPHGDRIPYLEMSEMWNSLIGRSPSFAKEIVISNAKVRGKSNEVYSKALDAVLAESARVLKPNGFLLVMFNARDDRHWAALHAVSEGATAMRYLGCIPLYYSAQSVVQDNREGSLKHDYVVVYQKGKHGREPEAISGIEGWSRDMPNTSGSKPENL